MTDVFIARVFDHPLDAEEVQSMGRNAADCLELYRVQWLESLLGTDGRRMLCHFRAPDAESGRLALRQAEGAITALWPGTVHESPAPPAKPPNVVVERRFAAPVRVESIQALEDAGASCLESHRVRFARTFFASSRQHMFCLYRAPDAESVRLAQRQAGMPLDRVWACHALRPEEAVAAAP